MRSLLLGLPLGLLEAVLAHLTYIERLRLRHTCRLLRHSAAVRDSFTFVGKHETEDKKADFFAASAMKELPNLRNVNLSGVRTLFPYHQLSGLSALWSVTLCAPKKHVDLAPLAQLPALSSLELLEVKGHTNLDQLTQLTHLLLADTIGGVELAHLAPSLQSFAAEPADFQQVPALQLLTRFGLWEGDHPVDEGLLWPTLQGLQGLRCLYLAAEDLTLAGLSTLTQLTQLQLSGAELPLQHTLSALVGLRQLCLVDVRACPAVLAPSVTSLLLMLEPDAALPDLSACVRLDRITLAFDSRDSAEHPEVSSRLHISRELLPLQSVVLELWLQPWSKVFFELGLEPSMRVTSTTHRFDRWSDLGW